MPRIDVPESFDGGHISVSGARDYHYGQSHVSIDHVDHARDLFVREDEDGRYVGPPEQYADAVREFLGVDADDADADICGAELSQGGICERPADECPYHGDAS